MTRLTGRRIVIVEDSYLLAMEIKSILENAGAEVVGPFPSVENAQLSMLQRPPDCAVLDINLGDGNSFDLARMLRMRGVPFLFFTGYDASALPPEFGNVERVEKPVNVSRLLKAAAACCLAALGPDSASH